MKRHNFKVGDKLESTASNTCVVARIDPACNNVYGKDFSNFRPDGDEISSPQIWRVIKSAAASVVTFAGNFVDSCEKFEVTILRSICGDPFKVEDLGATFVHRATVDKSGEGSYSNQVREYLKSVATTLTVPGEYIAVAIYGDNDTICVKFSTEKVEQPIAVNFDA